MFCLIFSLFSFNKYKHTGSVHTFTAPHTTSYKCECWGAQGGGTSSYPGGKGGFCSGNITFSKDYSFYIFIGGSGNNNDRIFNNGTYSSIVNDNTNTIMYAGGGSTDIRLSNGTWNDFNSLKTRFIVAAGGGGASTYHTLNSGGYAGGLIGGSYDTQLAYDGNSVENSGGTQTKGGINGGGTNSGITAGSIAGFGVPTEGTNGGGFGGNGYYAGGQGGHSRGTVGTGSGGSSFISGHTGCDAISESSTSSNIIHTDQPNHYSGKVFTNTVMKAGNESMPSPSGGTETGHTGNGYCKITWHPTL